MKRLPALLAFAVAALAAALVLWFRASPAPPVATPNAAPPAAAASPPQSPALPPSASVTVSAEPFPPPGSKPAGSPLAAELNASSGTAEHDVETLLTLLRQYLRRLHHRQGLPIGNDSDLARVLTGHNPMKAVILPPNHPALSPDGRLRDRWGTPYFIHPRGNGAFEIRSAGPDKKLFTADDVIANPGDSFTDTSTLPGEPPSP